MATATKSEPASLLSRTALVIYLASHEGETQKPPSFESLGHQARLRFERMAAAALTEALREPVG